MFKKILTVAILSLIPGAAFASFPDVYENDSYYDAINYVQEQGIVEGYPSGLFEPDMPMNRAEFTKILVESAYSNEEIENCTETFFPDVQSDDWFAPYVCTAKQNEIVDGYPDGNFKPSDYINFAEASKIIVNALSVKLAELEVGATHWYMPYVNSLANINAIPVSIEGFDEIVTRGQMAEMIYRIKADVQNKSSLKAEEIGYQSVIRAYYSAISNGEFEKAYAMKVDPGMSLEAFKDMYKDFPYSWLSDYQKVGDNTFSFSVVTLDFDREPAERYDVTMEVMSDKLKTVSANQVSEAVLETIVYDENLKAETVWNNGVYQIVVTRDGDSYVEYETHEESLAAYLDKVKFSKSGRYITFVERGWELAGVHLLDTVEHKIYEDNLMGVQLYGFDNDEEYFYFCSEAGMSGGMILVLDLPELSVRRVVADWGSAISSCGPYDEEDDLLYYQLYDKVDTDYVYDIREDAVSER